ncbi:MAG: hypothetical protein ACREF4_22305, partial [Gammaproteobacteria bacterium]
PSPTVTISNFNFSLATIAYSMNGTLTVPTGGPYAPFTGAAAVSNATACPTTCFAQVNGHFMGAGATHAGFAYNFQNVSATNVVGAAAFQR